MLGIFLVKDTSSRIEVASSPGRSVSSSLGASASPGPPVASSLSLVSTSSFLLSELFLVEREEKILNSIFIGVFEVVSACFVDAAGVQAGGIVELSSTAIVSGGKAL